MIRGWTFRGYLAEVADQTEATWARGQLLAGEDLGELGGGGLATLAQRVELVGWHDDVEKK